MRNIAWQSLAKAAEKVRCSSTAQPILLAQHRMFSAVLVLQVRVLRNVAFQHKQRAVREAVAIGEQVARRKRLELLAATFMAWHVQVGAVGTQCIQQL